MRTARWLVAVPGVLAAAMAVGVDARDHQPREAASARHDTAGAVHRSAIGTDTRGFEDAGRSNWPQTGRRPLRTILWYPAAQARPDAAPDAIDAIDATAASDVPAPLADANARYPLILVSHGAGSRAAHMDWLARALAASGCIVAAVDHNGSPEEELHSRPTPSDHFAWERAIDLRAMLDMLLDDPRFGPAIDRDRIGAAGFSLGGTTALWLAGARLDLDHLRHNAPPMPPSMAPAIGRLLQLPQANQAARDSQRRAERSHRDPRIRSVFALAPAMGFGFREAGLEEIGIPVRVVVGRDDPVTPPASNARLFANAIPTAQYIELPGERGHFTPRTPEDARAAELAEVAAFAVGFFRETLGPGGVP